MLSLVELTNYYYKCQDLGDANHKRLRGHLTPYIYYIGHRSADSPRERGNFAGCPAYEKRIESHPYARSAIGQHCLSDQNGNGFTDRHEILQSDVPPAMRPLVKLFRPFVIVNVIIRPNRML